MGPPRIRIEKISRSFSRFVGREMICDISHAQVKACRVAPMAMSEAASKWGSLPLTNRLVISEPKNTAGR